MSGAVALVTAHQALEALVLPRDLLQFKASVDRRFADLVYEGLWFSPLREALTAFVHSTQEVVTGEVTLRLHHGSCRAVARTSEDPLLSHELATDGLGAGSRRSSPSVSSTSTAFRTSWRTPVSRRPGPC